MVWTGSIWLGIGTSGGLLWTLWWTFGFHKMLGSSRIASQLAASQEGLSSVSKLMEYAVKIWCKICKEFSLFRALHYIFLPVDCRLQLKYFVFNILELKILLPSCTSYTGINSSGWGTPRFNVIQLQLTCKSILVTRKNFYSDNIEYSKNAYYNSF
jgi:hypothetical protein